MDVATDYFVMPVELKLTAHAAWKILEASYFVNSTR